MKETWLPETVGIQITTKQVHRSIRDTAHSSASSKRFTERDIDSVGWKTRKTQKEFIFLLENLLNISYWRSACRRNRRNVVEFRAKLATRKRKKRFKEMEAKESLDQPKRIAKEKKLKQNYLIIRRKKQIK